MMPLARPTDLDFLQANATLAALEQFVAILSTCNDPTGSADAQIIHATRAADALRRTWNLPTEAQLDAEHAATHRTIEELAIRDGIPAAFLTYQDDGR